jgi:hypothetical protein
MQSSTVLPYRYVRWTWCCTNYSTRDESNVIRLAYKMRKSKTFISWICINCSAFVKRCLDHSIISVRPKFVLERKGSQVNADSTCMAERPQCQHRVFSLSKRAVRLYLWRHDCLAGFVRRPKKSIDFVSLSRIKNRNGRLARNFIGSGRRLHLYFITVRVYAAASVPSINKH